MGLNDGQNFLYRLDRTSPLYINEVTPELLVDKLAYETGKIFYPLVVETKRDGKFLAIQNFDEIRIRWRKVRLDLETYYEGEYATRYIRLMDEKLMDDNFIQVCFKNDWYYMEMEGLFLWTWLVWIQD